MKQSFESDPFVLRRESMVQEQILKRGVHDRAVVKAMLSVPRHRFVPTYLEDQAYADTPLPLGEGQTISQPYIVAYMTEALRLTPDSRVLEIGTGSGYQTAVLARIVSRVFTVEIIPSLQERARTVLTELGFENISYHTGNGHKGWPEEGPYDAILVTASPHRIPATLKEQLRMGGILLSPEGDLMQNLVRVVRTPEGFETTNLLAVRFVPLVDEDDG